MKSLKKTRKGECAIMESLFAGYDQIPCGTTWASDHYAKHHIENNDMNFPLTVQHCRYVISPKRLKGFLMAPWMPTDEKNRGMTLRTLRLRIEVSYRSEGRK